MKQTPVPDGNAQRLSSTIQLTRLSVRWERMWRVLWAPVAALVLFVGIALSDALPVLPDFAHGMALALLAVLFGYAINGVRAGFRPVSDDEAARRAELASGLKHRPLTALFDMPAADKLTANGKMLWQAHIVQALRETQKLVSPMPKPGVAALDPLGLRFVPVLVLFVGVLMGHGNVWDRFERALSPIGNAQGGDPVQIDMWLTPPAYTGLAPSVFNNIASDDHAANKAENDRAAAAKGSDLAAAMPDATRQTLVIPVGSQILVHATDTAHQPVLRLGEKSFPLEKLGDGASTSFKLQLDIDAAAVGSKRLQLSLGRSAYASWPVVIAPDMPPEIEFERAPSRRHDTQLDVSYLGSDDYGIKTLVMTMQRPNGQPVPGGDALISFDVPLSGDRRILKASTVRDFSAHPWAGMPVRLQLIAADTAGQTGQSDAIEVVLPERIFNHPVARALAEARKALNDPNPAVMETVGVDLRLLSKNPKHFFDDLVAFLSIRVASNRLLYSGDVTDVPGVQKILWETALRIEDGEFALAESDLMRLQDEAMKALRDGKNGAELDQVMRALQDAMDRYMQALVDKLQDMGMDELPPMPDQSQLQTRDIQEMLDRIKDLAQAGNRDAAEQMLAQMQQMLEQLRQGLKMQNANPAMAEAKKLMDGLRSLSDDQQKLLDRTFQEGLRTGRARIMENPQPGQQSGQQQPGQQGQQPGQQGQQPGQQAGENGPPSAEEQAALRKRLGELMLQMDALVGQIPDNLGRADQQMEQSGRNLGKGELSDAARNQTQALEELRKATDQMSQALAQQFGAQMGLANGNRPAGSRDGQFDPFGRRNANGDGQGTAVEDSDVALPNRSELRRSREIIDELRRRSGDKNRPKLELDYIDRLLDVF